MYQPSLFDHFTSNIWVRVLLAIFETRCVYYTFYDIWTSFRISVHALLLSLRIAGIQQGWQSDYQPVILLISGHKRLSCGPNAETGLEPWN